MDPTEIVAQSKAHAALIGRAKVVLDQQLQPVEVAEGVVLVSYNELAEALTAKRGRTVTAKTVQSYHRIAKELNYPEGQFPAPDYVFDGKYPRWSWSKVARWDDQRPGSGWHGEGRPRGTKLTAEQKAKVRDLYKQGMSRKELAEQFYVSYVTVARITKPRVEQAVAG